MTDSVTSGSSGLAVEEHFAERAKERQREAAARATQNREAKVTNPQVNGLTVEADLPQPSRAPQARDDAARMVGGSGRGIQQAKKVKEQADLAAKVRTGEMALDRAYKEARQRERATPKPGVASPARGR